MEEQKFIQSAPVRSEGLLLKGGEATMQGMPEGWADYKQAPVYDGSFWEGVTHAGLANVYKYLNSYYSAGANPDQLVLNLSPSRIRKYGLIAKADPEWLQEQEAKKQRAQQRMERYEKSVYDNFGSIGGTLAMSIVDPANAIPLGKAASLPMKMATLGGINAGIQTAQVAGDDRLTPWGKAGSVALAGGVGAVFGGGQHAVGKMTGPLREAAKGAVDNAVTTLSNTPLAAKFRSLLAKGQTGRADSGMGQTITAHSGKETGGGLPALSAVDAHPELARIKNGMTGAGVADDVAYASTTLADSFAQTLSAKTGRPKEFYLEKIRVDSSRAHTEGAEEFLGDILKHVNPDESIPIVTAERGFPGVDYHTVRKDPVYREHLRANASTPESLKAGVTRNADTGWDLVITNKSASHAVSSASTRGLGGEKSAEALEAILHAPKLAQNAKLIESMPNMDPAKTDVVAVHKMFAPIRLTGGGEDEALYIVKMTVNEYGNGVRRASIDSIKNLYDMYLEKAMPPRGLGQATALRNEPEILTPGGASIGSVIRTDGSVNRIKSDAPRGLGQVAVPNEGSVDLTPGGASIGSVVRTDGSVNRIKSDAPPGLGQAAVPNEGSVGLTPSGASAGNIIRTDGSVNRIKSDAPPGLGQAAALRNEPEILTPSGASIRSVAGKSGTVNTMTVREMLEDVADSNYTLRRPYFQRKQSELVEEAGVVTMRFFKNADPSAPPYEIARAFRRLYESEIASGKGTPQMKADWDTLNGYVGAKAGEIWTALQDQKFGKAFAQYLKEGAAPDRRLDSVFAQFKKWLSDIYCGIRSTHLPRLSPEVREAFDRMLLPPERRSFPAPAAPGGGGGNTINNVASGYGKETFDTWLKGNINERTLLYMDHEKAAALLRAGGPNRPGRSDAAGITFSDLGSDGAVKLKYKSDFVNPIYDDTSDIRYLNMGINPMKALENLSPGARQVLIRLAGRYPAGYFHDNMSKDAERLPPPRQMMNHVQNKGTFGLEDLKALMRKKYQSENSKKMPDWMKRKLEAEKAGWNMTSIK